MTEFEGFEEIQVVSSDNQPSFFLKKDMIHCNSTVRKVLNNARHVHPLVNRNKLQFMILASEHEQDLPLSIKHGTSYWRRKNLIREIWDLIDDEDRVHSWRVYGTFYPEHNAIIFDLNERVMVR